MEQRRQQRKMVSMDAVIACARFGLIRGTIVDLAMGGGYVRAETSIVPISSEVTLTFQPDSELCSGCLTVSGRVSHQSLHGFGIEFHDLDPQCRRILQDFLPAMPPVPARAAPVLRAL
jgi:hypothetical protein